MANKLRGFRDYSEHDVINLFSHIDSAVDDGSVVMLNKNTNWDVKGWRNDDENIEGTSMLGDVGAAYNNTVSQRYGVLARVENCGTALADVPVGMSLYGVAELDENGEKLIYNPRKAAEMQVVVSGQALPVVSKGMFLYDYGTASTAIVGYNARVGAGGTIVTGGAGKVIGKWLGNSDVNGHALLHLDIANVTGKW
tara:strand:- start:1624 stop:2211 length:588 start_codon:yes stop_codon:yes gene_type:complete